MAKVKEHAARMFVRLPVSLKRKIERTAARHGVTASYLIRKVMRENLK